MSIAKSYLRGCQDALEVVEKVAGKGVGAGVAKALGLGAAGAAGGAGAGFGAAKAQAAAGGMDIDAILQKLRGVGGDNLSEGSYNHVNDALANLKSNARLGDAGDTVQGYASGLKGALGVTGAGQKMGFGGEVGAGSSKIQDFLQSLKGDHHFAERGGLLHDSDPNPLGWLANKAQGGWNSAMDGLSGGVDAATPLAGLAAGSHGGGEAGEAGQGLMALIHQLGGSETHNILEGAGMGGAAGLAGGAGLMAAKAMKGGGKKASGMSSVKKKLGLR